MPKAEKTEKTSEKKSGWGGGQLFGAEKDDTALQGGGFRDRDKAQQTINMLEGRDPSYQFQVVNSMYNRAKVILRRTTDKEKRSNLTEAVERFEEWLEEYKKEGKGKQGFSYLPLDTVQGYLPLAKHLGLPETGFLEAYQAADGDIKPLRAAKVEGKEVTWDVERNENLKRLSALVKEELIAPIETDGALRGLPSKEFVEMIMWAYNPEPSKVKKLISQISDKIKS